MEGGGPTPMLFCCYGYLKVIKITLSHLLLPLVGVRELLLIDLSDSSGYREGHCCLIEHFFKAASSNHNMLISKCHLHYCPSSDLPWSMIGLSLPDYLLGKTSKQKVGWEYQSPFFQFPWALTVVFTLNHSKMYTELAGPKTWEEVNRRADVLTAASSPSLLLISLWINSDDSLKIHKWHIHGTFLIPKWASLAIPGNSALLHSGSTWRRKLSLVTVYGKEGTFAGKSSEIHFRAKCKYWWIIYLRIHTQKHIPASKCVIIPVSSPSKKENSICQLFNILNSFWFTNSAWWFTKSPRQLGTASMLQNLLKLFKLDNPKPVYPTLRISSTEITIKALAHIFPAPSVCWLTLLLPCGPHGVVCPLLVGSGGITSYLFNGGHPWSVGFTRPE